MSPPPYPPPLAGEGRVGVDPSVIVVMGVSGAGKSTIAAMLAARLGWTYEDADWFDPPSKHRKDAFRESAHR
jgi:gluconokinase